MNLVEKLRGIRDLTILECGHDVNDWAEYDHECVGRAEEAADRIEALEAVLQAAVDCGMVPASSNYQIHRALAKEGGAVRHSEQVRVADRIRAALNKEKDQ